LVRDYLLGETHLGRFYGGSYRDGEAYRRKAREVDERFHRYARERAAGLLHPPSGASARRLEAFVEKGGYFVTTGQQPGLFTGPLYSIYKALSAVRLAQELESLLGRPVLALFWIASEDHDWPEANHTHLLDVHNELRTFELPPQAGPPHRPLHRIGLSEGLPETLAGFLEALPESEFSPPLFELIREAYAPGCTLPEGLHHLLDGLLADVPLFFVDGAHPDLKNASLPVLLRELAEAEEHEAVLSRTGGHLELEGYDLQVPILPGGVNLFFEGEEGRDRLYRDGSHFRLNRAGTSMTLAEIRARTEEDPSLLSPNVLLRPVVESSLFPTLGYVAGPGEIAYYAQLKELFHAHGLRMPVVYPRHSATLLEGKIRKVLDKFHFSPEAMGRPFHELAAEIAREELPDEARQALGEIRGAIGKGTGTLTRAVTAMDPTLKGPVTQARNAAFSAFDEAERKILQAVKRENEVGLEQLEKARRHLFPMGKPQERVLNVFYYLARYGPGLIPALLDEFPVALGIDSA
jgi:bacillithiol biosynthesis cysteine-adding enzyme BshC